MNYHHPWSAAATALERVFGRFAFPSPIRTLVIFQVIVAILAQFSPDYLNWLTLDRDKILGGQVWRLFTFLFIPRGSIWFIIFYLFIMWMVNDGLEQAWGEFRLNLYLFGTWLGLVIAAFFVPSGVPGYELIGVLSPVILYSSIFVAFASLYPNFEFLLFFILPLKVKWLALINGAMLFTMLLAGLPAAVVALLGMGPYLIVFLPKALHHLVHRSKTAARRSRFEGAQLKTGERGEAFHVCSRCGVSDAVDPDLDFRIGDDDEEYCAKCLPKSD